MGDIGKLGFLACVRPAWSNMTPVNMTAVMTLSLARSLTAVTRAGHSGCFSRSSGNGEGKISSAFRTADCQCFFLLQVIAPNPLGRSSVTWLYATAPSSTGNSQLHVQAEKCDVATHLSFHHQTRLPRACFANPSPSDLPRYLSHRATRPGIPISVHWELRRG